MNNVKIFAEIIDDKTKEQIEEISNRYPHNKEKIRIMPDCHLGRGSCIGFTEELEEGYVDPAFVGTDIGCGVSAFVFKLKGEIDFEKLDNFIKNNIPHGSSVNRNEDNFNKKYSKTKTFPYENSEDIKNLCKKIGTDYDRVKKSLGSLGSGNHFLELSYDESEDFYALIVHSGSRNLGNKVAEYYIQMAKDTKKEKRGNLVKNMIKEAKKSGKLNTINYQIGLIDEFMDNSYPDNCIDLFQSGYFKDMQTVQKFARLNRISMLQNIYKFMEKEFNILTFTDFIDTPHNYIEWRRWESKVEDRKIILRKGAISAKEGEVVLIPFNMRDGVILAKGKGNKDWNESAPHGAGRVLSRTQARENLKDSDVRDIMKGIYTSTAQKCIDELPDVYKPIDKILPLLNETVEIIRTFKPLYNFKSEN